MQNKTAEYRYEALRIIEGDIDELWYNQRFSRAESLTDLADAVHEAICVFSKRKTRAQCNNDYWGELDFCCRVIEALEELRRKLNINLRIAENIAYRQPEPELRTIHGDPIGEPDEVNY